MISIHTPRGGSDFLIPQSKIEPILFQSTLPVGGATSNEHNLPHFFLFQSTLPVGGATATYSAAMWSKIFQSTLPVGGATAAQRLRDMGVPISIHTPRGGSDR